MTKPDHPEVGRALLASDLRPGTVVCVQKNHCDVLVTLWVAHVAPTWVHFHSSEIRVDFIARRHGPDNELLTDASGLPIQTYEFLGEV